MAQCRTNDGAHQPTHELDLSRKARGNRKSGRLRTAYRSFRVLRRLEPSQVDAFLASYIIYSLDWNDEKRMLEVLGPNYQQRIGECLGDYYSVLNQ